MIVDCMRVKPDERRCAARSARNENAGDERRRRTRSAAARFSSRPVLERVGAGAVMRAPALAPSAGVARRPAELAPGVVVQQHPEGVEPSAVPNGTTSRLGTASTSVAAPRRGLIAGAAPRPTSDHRQPAQPRARCRQTTKAQTTACPDAGLDRQLGKGGRRAGREHGERHAGQHAERAPDDVQPAEHVEVQPHATWRWRYRAGTEERALHALDDRGHVDEVDGRIGAAGAGGARPRARARRLAEVGMRPIVATGHARRISLGRSVVGHAEDLEVVVHG